MPVKKPTEKELKDFLNSLTQGSALDALSDKLKSSKPKIKKIIEELLLKFLEEEKKDKPRARATAKGLKEAVLYVDGASRGNPGVAGCGAVIMDKNGNIVRELRRKLGKATNNVAEYSALLLGVEAAISLGIASIRIFADSELMVKQINGQYKVKNEGLRPLFIKAMGHKKKFGSFTIAHVKRDKNEIADRLANEAIDGV